MCIRDRSTAASSQGKKGKKVHSSLLPVLSGWLRGIRWSGPKILLFIPHFCCGSEPIRWVLSSGLLWLAHCKLIRCHISAGIEIRHLPRCHHSVYVYWLKLTCRTPFLCFCKLIFYSCLQLWQDFMPYSTIQCWMPCLLYTSQLFIYKCTDQMKITWQ